MYLNDFASNNIDTMVSTVAQIKWAKALALVVLILSALSITVAPSSWADSHALTSFSSTPMKPGELSEKAAVDKALAEFSGQVLSVKPQAVSGKPAFRIQILSSSGRVKVINIDRNSGEVIR